MEKKTEKSNGNPAGVDPLSIISLIVSILGVVVYAICFENNAFVPLFVVLGIASIILPCIAKNHRIRTNKAGKWMEIVSIIVGGFNFYCIIFALTSMPIFIGYLGWVVCGIVYKQIR